MFTVETTYSTVSFESYGAAVIQVSDVTRKLMNDGFSVKDIRYSWEGMLIDFSKIEDGVLYKTEIRMWNDRD